MRWGGGAPLLQPYWVSDLNARTVGSPEAVLGTETWSGWAENAPEGWIRVGQAWEGPGKIPEENTNYQ